MGLSYEEFNALFPRVKHEAIHLEMRDSYGTETELPHLAKWAAGQPDELEWLEPWCSMIRASTAAGKVFRRAKVISEPLSDYQQWAYSVMAPLVDAGEDVRWVPRRLISELSFPGNDFWLFDDELVVFLVFAGNGLVNDRLTSMDPAVVQLCRASFEAAWPLAIPHREYGPT